MLYTRRERIGSKLVWRVVWSVPQWFAAGLVLAATLAVAQQQPQPPAPPRTAPPAAGAAQPAQIPPAKAPSAPPLKPSSPQPPKAPPPTAQTSPQATQPPASKEKLPPSVQLGAGELLTQDGVQLVATFYPAAESKGKDAVPVILLHTRKGSRADFESLAPMLQREGCAVLVPDLRGHGDSTRVVGSTRTLLDANRLSPDQFGRMVRFDMETLKAFLMKQNNEEKLNIEKLTIVGAEMGAAVALEWARMDWSWPVLGGGRKQGQDVKALVLISPDWAVPGLSIQNALEHPAIRSGLSVLIVAGGEDSKAAADAKRLHKLLEAARPKASGPQQNLFLGLAPTKLQGTKLLGVRELKIGKMTPQQVIGAFIQLRVASQPYQWQKRN